jgi:Fe2+ or Zn2+ uptake regulation protein
VGWSKKKNREYVHKIPKDAFDQTVAVIAGLAEASSVSFTSDQIIEEAKRGGSPVPAYQVYLTLAFLREYGGIKKEGREGYAGDAGLMNLAAEMWREFSQ